MSTIGDKEADKKSKTLGNVMIGGAVAAIIGLFVFSVNEIVAYVEKISASSTKSNVLSDDTL